MEVVFCEQFNKMQILRSAKNHIYWAAILELDIRIGEEAQIFPLRNSQTGDQIGNLRTTSNSSFNQSKSQW